MRFNWKIGGEAGFGIVTGGQVLAKLATRAGYHIFTYMEYPSLIRGGHNTVELLVSDEPVTAQQHNVDLLVCLNKETYDLHQFRLNDSSYVIYDPEEFTPEKGVKVPIPFKEIKKKEVIHQQMVNTIAIGASLAVMGADIGPFDDILRKQFARKGEEVVNFNIKLAQMGYDAAKEIQEYKLVIPPREPEHQDPKVVMTGNDMFSLASVAAGCKYYAAYPMTPASSVLMTLAPWQDKAQMVVRHSEDEIAVINSALGASFVGVRSAVGTSGGGFALMVEALSYAGIAEIPIVVFLSMRPGPATGMPTWTEQGDLMFAVFGGHGEFPKIILAAGDIDEMAALTLEAYNLADIYQTPVIVLSDKHLSESYKDMSKAALDTLFGEYKINRGKIVTSTEQSPYLRFKMSEDGISEKLIPGAKGSFYQANSYEHAEDSHTSEESKDKIAQTDKRSRKMDTYIKTHFQGPTLFGDPDAETVIVSWGSLKGIILEAQKTLSREHGKNIAYMHFTHMFPLDEQKIREQFKENKRYILIENNSHGQFAQLLRMQTGIELKEKFLKYDGRPFWPEEIVAYLLK